MQEKVAVVVSTYNSPRELGFCLTSLLHQTFQDFDLYIADDGSGTETQAVIDRFKQHFGQRLTHLWQEDRGFTKSEINNKVFRLLKHHSVAIMIDGDTFVQRNFLADHLSVHRQYSGKEMMFMGRRVNLGPVLSKNLTEAEVKKMLAGLSWRLLLSGLRGDSQNWARAWRITSPFWRTVLKRDRVPDLLGSNFSISVSLLYRVNGYNEDYQNYWGEDGDLFVRVRNTGALLLGSKSMAIQYHVYHPFRSPQPGHLLEYQTKLANWQTTTCKKGIQLLDR